MKKIITILAQVMGYSGVQREIVALANSLVDLYDVEILFLEQTNEKMFIDSKVRVIIKKPNLLESHSFYDKLLRKSDVVIATHFSFSYYVEKYAKGKRIFWTHEFLPLTHKNSKMLNKYDHIVVPSKKGKEYYVGVNPNTLIINDGIVLPNSDAVANGKNIIFVGKLTKEKKLTILFDVFLEVKKVVDTSLVLIGTGEERKNLEEIVKTKQIPDISFKGLLDKEEITQELLSSAVYVTTGESDNSNLSILEALSY